MIEKILVLMGFICKRVCLKRDYSLPPLTRQFANSTETVNPGEFLFFLIKNSPANLTRANSFPATSTRFSGP